MMAALKALVLKFGGSCLKSHETIAQAMENVIAEAQQRPVVTVVSAVDEVTDELLTLGKDALHSRKRKVDLALREMRRQHERLFFEFTRVPESREWIKSFLDEQFAGISGLLQGVTLLGEFSDRTRDKLLSFGEVLSSNLLARVLADRNPKFGHSDAREWIVGEWSSQGLIVDFAETEKRIQAALSPVLQRGRSLVAPGFICRTFEGEPATLGRNGSDYSASLVGAALCAREIWIYKDVDGVLTADPELVAEARILRQISYQEAAEMSYFGAKVLHPKTMTPAILRHVPIRIKNLNKPQSEGTLIADTSSSRPLVKTVTSVRNLALLNVQGNGMLGLPGITSRLFQVLAREDINIMMIAQSSSAHSVCVITLAADAERALQAVRQEFQREVERNLLEGVSLTRDAAIVAVIGAGMRGTPGTSGKFFDALGKHRINVLAIAQGASELNISAAIREKDYRQAVQAVHSSFGLTRDLNVFLFGCGNIGKTLLRQILENRKTIARSLGVNVRVLGVANSRNWLFSAGGLSGATLKVLSSSVPFQNLPGALPNPNPNQIFELIASTCKSDVVLVDATAAELASAHIGGLRRGFHIVTANKKPLTTSLADYQQIQRLRRRKGLSYHYEATFGAGLPLLSTLQDLINTGDRVVRVQGCLSGTLGFICSRMDEGIPISCAVSEAMSLGYTEPDPRDDLNGLDVARKSLIIARELGVFLELNQVKLESMIPASFFNGSAVPEFLSSLRSADSKLLKQCEQARSDGKVLRFVADITEKGCEVGLKKVPKDSPVGRLAGPDNILVFQTQRYLEHPLVIQGPGAGASVTSAGVLGDILKIAKSI